MSYGRIFHVVCRGCPATLIIIPQSRLVVNRKFASFSKKLPFSEKSALQRPKAYALRMRAFFKFAAAYAKKIYLLSCAADIII